MTTGTALAYHPSAISERQEDSMSDLDYEPTPPLIVKVTAISFRNSMGFWAEDNDGSVKFFRSEISEVLEFAGQAMALNKPVFVTFGVGEYGRQVVTLRDVPPEDRR